MANPAHHRYQKRIIIQYSEFQPYLEVLVSCLNVNDALYRDGSCI